MLIRSCLELQPNIVKAISWNYLVYRTSAVISSKNHFQARKPYSWFSAKNLVQKAPLSWQPYLRLMRVDSPTGTWLLFWPCTWSIGLAAPAGALPSMSALALFGIGSFLMRAGGCIINDILDQKYDKLVERTKYRPLPSGELSNKDAVVTLGFLLSASLAVLLQFNWFSVAVGSSSLIFAVLYPFAKRCTYWPQVILGITLNYGVLISWAHLQPNNFFEVTPLFIATVLHTIIYDSIYSHQVFCRLFHF
uniref:4-hydroxybenzoate polyprenyltransferase n=1 Tax=Syphacia muris TaxID=451379 RepID=A0A0N5A904_9BILA